MKRKTGIFSGSICRLARQRRRFRRDESGVTAIEFGLLGLPFFALVAATMETALVFMAGSVFDTALQDAVRIVRTGQAASTAGYDIDDFRTEMCEHTYGLFDCSKIVLKVTKVASFGSVSFNEAYDEDADDWAVTESFEAGLRNEIMAAEAYYKWETLFDIGGFNLASLSSGALIMGSAQVFRNEPF